MNYKVEFDKDALKTVGKWKKSNPRLYKKFLTVLAEMIEHPRTGIGHPEALVGGNDITYSRRISAHDRIIYNIYDDILVVLVIQVEEHYNDK